MDDNRDKTMRARGRLKPASFFLKQTPEAAIVVEDEVVRSVADVCGRAGVKAYLVGGVVRNLLLGCNLQPDYDFVISGGVELVAKAIARRVKGTAFVLDKQAPSYRVVFKKGRPSVVVTIDISPFKGASAKTGTDADIIAADLKERDFTIDAMAVDLTAVIAGREVRVIDPCNGLRDAKARRVVVTSKRVFKEDPLRMLRAVRLAARYGLTITDDTARLIKTDAALLADVSVERIRAELVSILDCKGAAASVRALYDLGLIGAVIPQIKDWKASTAYDILGHTLAVLDAAECLLDDIGAESLGRYSQRVKRHFARSVGGMRRAVRFKLAVLLHDVGKPGAMTFESGSLRFYGHDSEGALLAASALRRLKFSRRVCAAVSTLVRCHHRVFGLAVLKTPSARAKAHLLRSAGTDLAPELLCLALVDAHATRGGPDPELVALVRELFRFYFEIYLKKTPAPVMTGAEVMKTFGVCEGPVVGEILAYISDGVVSGAVRTRKDAVELVRKWLKQGRGGG